MTVCRVRDDSAVGNRKNNEEQKQTLKSSPAARSCGVHLGNQWRRLCRATELPAWALGGASAGGCSGEPRPAAAAASDART